MKKVLCEEEKEILQNKWREYRMKNKDTLNKKNLERYYKNKDALILKNREWKKNNKEKVILSKKNYIKNNKELINKKREIYKKEKRENDNVYKLKYYLGVIIRGSLKRKGYTKKSRTFEILGCSYEHFKLHLESYFEPWMTWDNYGKWNGELNYGWDIDHIIPISSGNTEEDIIKLNHYTNLKPLCSQVNRYIKKDNPDY